ncbi:MAG: chemotaxis response regulator protein-glutamate methylesterase [Pirellulales bacterium]|nr:chemotaxis response regulator protein-glutamate methylesterase [Pirellulales bacterium]MDA8042124.1 chemotaxis response regulator protein-glutamate methylesterase [Pirellulales bacterium]
MHDLKVVGRWSAVVGGLVRVESFLRVLVVDDSSLYRQMLMRALAEVDGVEVIDVACDGVEALEKIERLQPDLVTLDVQMPKLDGLGVLREVSRRSLKTTILMVSSVTAEGAPATVDALLNGAMDCILKPSGVDAKEERHELRNALADRVEAILLTMSEAEPRYNVPQSTVPKGRPVTITKLEDVIVVGASTGGPQALRTVLRSLPDKPDVPVFIVQHMPSAFTASLAKRLNEIVAFPVRLASTGMPIEPGTAYLAPGKFHLTVMKRGTGLTCRLTEDPPRQGCRPSLDCLLESLVPVYGSKVVAAVLTGMGSDGLEGCRSLKAAGGVVIAQDRQGCTVYGMPKAVIDAGLADVVLPLDQIGEAISGNQYRKP